MNRILTSISTIILFAGTLLLSQVDLVQPGDLLAIYIPGEEQNHGEFEVTVEGKLFIPLIGVLNVLNMTTTEVESEISNHLPNYLRTIQPVKVNLITRQIYVEISGHVRNPGWYKLPSNTSLESALTAAGGMPLGARLDSLYLVRNDSSASINLLQYRLTGNIQLIPELKSKDKIIVPVQKREYYEDDKLKAQPRVDTRIRVAGAVKSPGIYDFIEDASIYDYIILSNGWSEEAKFSKVAISRGDNTININLRNVLRDQEFDIIPKAMPGDMIFVHSKHETFLTESWKYIKENTGTLLSLTTLYLYWRNN